MPNKSRDTDLPDLIQALGLFVQRFRAMGGPQDLSWTDTMVLRRLDKEGPATAAELAREMGITAQSMGTKIAALEAKGWISRKPHPTDGRRLSVALSPGGTALRREAGDARRKWLAQSVARLDAGERESLFAAAAILKRLAES